MTLAGPTAGVGTVVGKGQTDVPCRKSLGMESVFSEYWEGIRMGGYGGRKRKRAK